MDKTLLASTRPSASLLRKISADISATASAAELKSYVRCLKNRDEILPSIADLLTAGALEDEERLRSVAVKLLLASYPATLEYVLKIIRSGHPEARFTLFCFLDDVALNPGESPADRAVFDATESYLMHLRTDRTLAGWKASESFGEHWSISESVEALLRILQSGRYVESRKLAVAGLEAAYGRADARCRDDIRRALQNAGKVDRSSTVRSIALNATLGKTE
jgi:hypothetical protein